MAVCCQNLPLGVLNSRSAPSVLVGELFIYVYNKPPFSQNLSEILCIAISMFTENWSARLV
jgi:hypothetical protein